ncbi:ThuA domain-containing protein [Chitinophaga pendula]|uniref:ThuA domain-containing protein n=1 Tax=Chitinophaga TaxID=79328 RepID=UPI000BAFD3BB|nr:MULTISPECIES: ThuA domain-containing protein [Chitinophaga]ASZ14763.1 Crp/Fnr family transcriptional regulator [Chitinophaga sp. MD30]UCJ07279.1 ThuA domain-containing protein [Chitinophaga pendula]
MNRLVTIILLLVISTVVSSCEKCRPGKPKVLIFAHYKDQHQAVIPAAINAIQEMGIEYGFEVDTTRDASLFDEDTLTRYAAVIFLNTSGNLLDHTQKADFERYIQAGGGYVGIHAAASTAYDWDWYGQLLGAYVDEYPAPLDKASLKVHCNVLRNEYNLPRTWEHNDEWYNFTNLSKDIRVAICADEKTYQGGVMGAEHPVCWCHEFNGGRAFYTALGHTEESYTETYFLQHLLYGIRYAIGKNIQPDYKHATTPRVPAENRFTKTTLSAGQLFEPTEMAILPDRSVLITQRRGEIMYFDNKTQKISQVGFLKVYYKSDKPDAVSDEGVLGITADPAFEKNHYVYIYYSPADVSVNRLSRFRYEHHHIDTQSEKVVLEVDAQRETCCHTGGSLAFDPTGLLYLSTGDNTSPFDEPAQTYGNCGFTPLDDRPGHTLYDARRTAANTNDLRGKILRIKINADGSYAIPEGNLYAPGTPHTRPEIYVMGNRNPYRIAVDRKTNFLYWGDVGPDANNDHPKRGPMGYDEINQAKGPGNYGYPMFIGNNYAYREYNYATGESGPSFNPLKPINNSRNNTGLKELPAAHSAFIWYPYARSTDFPQLGSGGRNAMAGPVYYPEYYPAASRYPDYYSGKLFVYDWVRGWIKAVTMDKNSNYLKMEPFMEHTCFNSPIDMELGPDGRIYLLEYGSGWFSKNPNACLSRLDYNSGNRAPMVEIKTDKLTGGLPFTATFKAIANDPDGDPLKYRWQLGNGRIIETNTPEFTFTCKTAGEYQVSVAVIDDKGAHNCSNVLTLYAGNETPQVSIRLQGNKMFYFPDKRIHYAVTVSDKEDGSSAAGNLDMSNSYIKAEYVGGLDKAAIPQRHEIISDAIAGKNIMESYDCRSCHKQEEKSVGPSFLQIAKRYKKDPKAIKYLAGKILHGAGGTWGENTMAAYTALSETEAYNIIHYIFSLMQTAQRQPSLPLSGEIDPTLGQPIKNNGVFYLLASYTDKGGPGIKPITSNASVQLINARIPAESFDKADGASAMEVDGVKYVIPTAQGWVMYKDLDLTDVNGISLIYYILDVLQYGYIVEARLDHPEGTKLGEVLIGPDARPQAANIKTITFPLRSDRRLHSLYLRIHAANPNEIYPLGLKYVQLLTP